MAPNRRPSLPARSLDWVFRVAPADGGKDFGNAGFYATPQAIRTIVREDGQNSLDAAQSHLTLRFRLIELSSGTERHRRFLKAMRFGTLAEHIDAIEGGEFISKLGTKLVAAKDHLEEENLVLLIVEDFGAHGLVGDEFDSTKPFSALARDNLNSRKEVAQTAGGVFGLGAKANLACSRLSTVLFASKVAGAHKKGIRLFGRSETTYHEAREGRTKKRFAGPAWFGRANREGVAESIWLNDQDPLLEDLFLHRRDLPNGVRATTATGTSLLIVGFTDPQTESGATVEQLSDHFAEAAAVNFWPAMLKGQLTVWVDCFRDDTTKALKATKVDPWTVSGVRELCDAWSKYQKGDLNPLLGKPGDVVGVQVPMIVPAAKTRVKGVTQHGQMDARAMLLIRLGNGDGSYSDPRLGRIAYVRGRGMVTRYQARSTAAGGRAFHSVLLTGTLLGHTVEQKAAEEFLRLSEPPAHDKWEYNQDLREKYAWGAKRVLDHFLDRVTEELQRVLRPSSIGTKEGPEALKKLLHFGGSSRTSSRLAKAKILSSTAFLEGGAWNVTAELSLSGGAKPIIVYPRLVFQSEGTEGIPVAWKALGADIKDAKEMQGGLLLPARSRRVTIKALSDPTTHPVDARFAAARLEIGATYGAQE
jgi:hypothetical protein